MIRVQVELDDDLADYLERRAEAAGESLAGTVAEIIAASRANDERERRIEIALAALRKSQARSDVPDLAENHDEYLGRILDEEVERWRRG